MAERDTEGFELDDELLGEASSNDSGEDYDRFLDRVDRRAKPQPGKRGKAAWSKLEEVLAEKRLAKDLRDYDDDDL
jgi:hypothetical protein